MNNIFNLNLDQIPANDNIEITPDSSQTLDLLRKSAQSAVLDTLTTSTTPQSIKQQVDNAKNEIDRLEQLITPLEDSINQSIDTILPGLNTDQKKIVLDIARAILCATDPNQVPSAANPVPDTSKQSFKNFLSNTDKLPDFTDVQLNDLIDTFTTQDTLFNYQQSIREQKIQEEILKNSLDTLLGDIEEKKQSEYLKLNILKKTGIHLKNDLTATLSIAYQDESGSESRFNLQIQEVQFLEDPNSEDKIIIKISYRDPLENTDVTAFITPAALRNIVAVSKAQNTNLSSLDRVNKALNLSLLGVPFSQGAVLEYQTKNNGLQTITLDQVNSTEVILSEQVHIDGEDKANLTFPEFAKWASLHDCYPQISTDQLNTAILKLPELASNNLSVTVPAPEDPVVIQPGVKFKSNLIRAQVLITSVATDKISYQYNDAPIKEVTNSAFLNLLSSGYFSPEIPGIHEVIDAATPSASNNEGNNGESDNEGGGNMDNPGDNSFSFSYGGMPALLKPSTYSGALGWALTLGGNVTWFSYNDVATELIPKIVENIKGSLSNSNKRKLGEFFKNHPMIGEEFARMESGAKKELVEDYSTKLNRLGSWKKVREIIFNTNDVFEFIAASKFLQEKGYLPTYDRKYLENVRKFSNKLGKEFEIPTPIQANRAIIDKNLISFYDDLLDPGEGVRMINANKSNKQSAIQEYRRQAEEIFNPPTTQWALTRLHTMIHDFSTGGEIDPHEYEGYLLGAYDSGEVDEVQLLTYIGLGLSVKDKQGDTLVLGFESLLGEFKKQFMAFNMFMDDTQNEFVSFFQSNILDSSGKIPMPADGNKNASFQERFGSEKSKKIQNFVYWTNLTKTVSKKQNDYLAKRELNKDFAGYSLFTHGYENLRDEYVFIKSNLSSSSLAPDQVNNSMKTFPRMLEAYSNVVTEGESNYWDKPGRYPNHGDKIAQVIFNYILLEGAYSGRVKTNSSATVGGILSPDNLADTDKVRKQSQQSIRLILSKIPGITRDEIDGLFQSYNGQRNSSHADFLRNLEHVRSKVSGDAILSALDRS